MPTNEFDLQLTTTNHARDVLGEESVIYPVSSRRLGGLSVGINTAPQITCNFGCAYCEVDFSQGPKPIKFDVAKADFQLRGVLEKFREGKLGPETIKAITLSGDGEPTALLDFEGVIRNVIAARDDFGLTKAKVIVISNASGLNRKTVIKGLELMDGNNGQLWAKLDAGTDDYFQRIARTKVPFGRILDNLLSTSKIRPIQIQTCIINMDGQMPDAVELEAYATRVNHILAEGGQIEAIQLYTIARLPKRELNLSPLTDEQKIHTTDMLRRRIPVLIEFYS